ncbi:NAD-dependent epimerase/dehydratase family protein [bacterium 1XD21-13]|nr:NAD-dependent epimerase/dehydratase family protein [bacterium 1XD21-13]
MNQIIQKDCEALYKEHGMEWSRIKNTSILITGACGMLPAYMIWMLIYLNEYENYHIRILALCRSAERAYAVFGEYARKDYFELIMADVTEPFQVEQELDYVIHAASISGSQYFGMDPVGVIMPNVQGTRYTLELAREKRAKGYLYFSSSEIYGRIEKEFIEEKDCGYLDSMNLRSCYGESKRLGENLCKAYSHQYALRTVVVRPAQTFGPTMNLKQDKRVHAEFVSNILNQEALLIKSDGLSSRNFCYIYDGVFGYFKALLDGNAGEAYNVSNPACKITIRGLAELLVKTFPEKELKIVYANHDNAYLENPYKKQSTISVDKLKALGWTPRISLEEGFHRTVRSFMEEN